jgi:hypothetical protein
MGLDMYLEGERFLWSEEREKHKDKFAEVFPETANFGVEKVIIQAGYWRKANHIHKWFVDNIQNGEDNCNRYYVDREQLAELSDICRQVINKEANAIDVLPTESGFFFGNTEYDEYYMEVLKNTVEIIEKCLKLSHEWDFYYQSSW